LRPAGIDLYRRIHDFIIYKTRDLLATHIYHTRKHRQWSHPQRISAIKASIDHHQLFGFTVPCHTNHLVELALVVPVVSRLKQIVRLLSLFLPKPAQHDKSAVIAGSDSGTIGHVFFFNHAAE
jgi:hypothetical protein